MNVGDGPRAKVSIYLPADEHRQLRVHVAEAGVNLNALVGVLLRRYLAAAPTDRQQILEEVAQLVERRRGKNP